MNKLVFYRKQIEILEFTRTCIEENDYNRFMHIRGGYFDLFFENQFNLKSELVEIIPTNNISAIRFLIETLKNAYNFSNDKIYADNNSQLTFEVAVRNIDYLISVINDVRNRISAHSVFYSWENDRLSSVNRSFIESCLEGAIKKINKELPYKLFLDKDTRGTPGSPNIPDIICQKIDASFCFVADVTPVTKEKDKLLPNANVMYETGFAVSSLGDKRVILVNNSHYGNVEKLPFDIKIRRIANYSLSKRDTPETRQEEKDKLTNIFYLSLKSISNL